MPAEPQASVKESLPLHEISLRPKLAEFMFGGVRQEYGRMLEAMRADNSSTPTSYISEDIQGSDVARLARYGVDQISQAHEAEADTVPIELSDADIDTIRRYLPRSGEEGRITREMLEEFDGIIGAARTRERAEKLRARLRRFIPRK